ncbi:MAG: glycosyltransferase family 4 protein [Peptococcaceae bacterium]|nr:glycosyltransferase family 4 protein [Peptococcaceae bacterium]
MRIIMLSWEYPPKSVGGLAQHVYDLTSALAEIGEDVHLVTVGSHDAPQVETVNGVKVYRVYPYQVSSLDFVHWVTQLNVAMLEKAASVMNDEGGFHLVHSHDWLAAYAARAVKHAYRIPLVATIHATEYGRNYGLHNDLQRHISDVEWWLIYESWRVICCSHYMRGELQHVFQVPDDKIRIIPNGVNASAFQTKNSAYRREDYASPDEQIVLYVGRLVREKGVQVLIDAIPHILKYRPGTKFIIAGRGPYENALRNQAAAMGIANRIYFTGYVNDELRNALYSWASVAVIPSLYEPFGIVALEAMAAQAPVVISDTGGLSEIVRHTVDGLKAYPGNSQSLADMVIWLLNDRSLAENMKRKAYSKVQREYNWLEIARQTREVYREILNARRSTAWYEGDRYGGIFDRVSRLFGRTG